MLIPAKATPRASTLQPLLDGARRVDVELREGSAGEK